MIHISLFHTQYFYTLISTPHALHLTPRMTFHASRLTTNSSFLALRHSHPQERGGMQCFEDKDLAMRYRQNNEFELVFVVAYQRILQLSYMDKFLTSIEAAFRDKYKQQLLQVSRRMSVN